MAVADSWLRKTGSALLDILFPSRCASCEEHLGKRSLFCPSCSSKLIFAESPLCPLCGKVFSSRQGKDHLCGECLRKKRPFRKARALALYEGPIMEAIHRMKYQGRAGLVDLLSALLLEHIPNFYGEGWDILVPVPLHPARLRERGFNQSALLAIKLGKNLGIPVEPFSLRKICPTPPQVGLTMKERVKNVSGAFQVKDKNIFNKKIVLLIDDVLTTGATVSECSRVLKRAGARAVDVLTLARTP